MTALERYFLEKPDVVMLDLVMKGHVRARRADQASRARSRRRASIVVSADVQQLVAGAGRSGWRESASSTNRRSRAAAQPRPGRARRVGRHEADGRSGRRAHRAAEHRVRAGGRIVVAADRAPSAARGAARHHSSDRRGDGSRSSASSQTTSPACTRSSAVRWQATRC